MVVEGYAESQEEDSVEEKVATKQFAIPETEGHRCTLNNLLVFSKQDPKKHRTRKMDFAKRAPLCLQRKRSWGE